MKEANSTVTECDEIITKHFMRLLGLCRRAGKTVHGTPLVCTALAKKKPPCLVVMSEGASAATQKKLTSKCSFYKVPIVAISVPTDALAHAVGKTGDIAAVAVTDEGFARELLRIHAERKGSPSDGEEGTSYGN